MDCPAGLERSEPVWLYALVSRVEFNRLRWRCRRGLLENDLILARFLDTRGAGISAQEIVALDRLLELGDNELWELISSRQEVADPGVASLLEALRAVRACGDAPPPGSSVSDSAWE